MFKKYLEFLAKFKAHNVTEVHRIAFHIIVEGSDDYTDVCMEQIRSSFTAFLLCTVIDKLVDEVEVIEKIIPEETPVVAITRWSTN